MRDEIILSPQRWYPFASIFTPKVRVLSGDICCNRVSFFLKRVNFDKTKCALLWNFTQPNNLTLEDGIDRLSWNVRKKLYSILRQIPEQPSSHLHRNDKIWQMDLARTSLLCLGIVQWTSAQQTIICIWFFLKGRHVSDCVQNMREFCAYADQQSMKAFLLKTSKTSHSYVRQNKEIFKFKRARFFWDNHLNRKK